MLLDCTQVLHLTLVDGVPWYQTIVYNLAVPGRVWLAVWMERVFVVVSLAGLPLLNVKRSVLAQDV